MLLAKWKMMKETTVQAVYFYIKTITYSATATYIEICSIFFTDTVIYILEYTFSLKKIIQFCLNPNITK